MNMTADKVFEATLQLTGVDRARNLAGRIEIQKVAFLVQLLLDSTAYRFHWGKHGPYSPTLAEDLGEHARNQPKGLGSLELFQAIERHGNVNDSRSHEILELVGSFAFLTKRLGMKPGAAYDDLLQDDDKKRLLTKYCPTDNAENPGSLDQLTKNVINAIRNQLPSS